MLRLCVRARLPEQRWTTQAITIGNAQYSTKPPNTDATNQKSPCKDEKPVEQSPEKRKKTLVELDEEMKLAMEGLSGDGGLAGASLEGGKPVSMARSVKDNMFRYI